MSQVGWNAGASTISTRLNRVLVPRRRRTDREQALALHTDQLVVMPPPDDYVVNL
jgi:hypothetical protein